MKWVYEEAFEVAHGFYRLYLWSVIWRCLDSEVIHYDFCWVTNFWLKLASFELKLSCEGEVRPENLPRLGGRGHG